MKNALRLVVEDLQNHLVDIRLPGEKEEKQLFLIMVTAVTSKLEDLQETYGEDVTNTHLKIAEKVFGTEKAENTYGVLLDDDKKMVFAFNREFADYNRSKKEIVYTDLDTLLVEKIEPKQKLAPSFRPPRNSGSGRGGGSMIMRYSLPEK
jgi:hypothetical protein